MVIIYIYMENFIKACRQNGESILLMRDFNKSLSDFNSTMRKIQINNKK